RDRDAAADPEEGPADRVPATANDQGADRTERGPGRHARQDGERHPGLVGSDETQDDRGGRQDGDQSPQHQRQPASDGAPTAHWLSLAAARRGGAARGGAGGGGRG